MLSLHRAVPCVVTQANVDPTARYPVLKKLTTLLSIQNSDKFKAVEYTEQGNPHQYMKKFVDLLDKTAIVYVMEPVADGTGNRFGEQDKVCYQEASSEVKTTVYENDRSEDSSGNVLMVWYGMVWYGMVMVLYGKVWYGMVWDGMVK